MKGYDSENSEEHLAKQEAKRFERSMKEGAPYFLDSATMDLLFNHYLRRERFSKALSLVDFAIEQNGESDEYLYQKSLVLYELKRPKEALIFLKKALNKAPDNFDYHVLKSDILSSLGLYDRAINVLEKFKPHCPEEALFELYLQMADLAYEANRLYEAEKYYRSALAENPDDEEAFYELILLLGEKGKQKEAIACCKAFLDNQPFNEQVWYQYGAFLAAQEAYEEALEAFDFTLALRESLFVAWLDRAEVLYQLKRYGEAIKSYLEAEAQSRRLLESRMGIGRCYEAQEEWELAGKYYQEAGALSPEEADAWEGVARVLEKKEQYFAAVFYYRKALDNTKEDTYLMACVARCEFLLGNRVSAYEALKVALEKEPGNIAIWAEWSILLGREEGYVHAISFAREGLKLNAGDARFYFLCAGLYLRKNSPKRAITYLENGLIVNASQHDFLYEYFPETKDEPGFKLLISQYMGH